VADSAIGQQDAFAARLDKTTGTLVWATAAGSAASDFTTALAFDAAGNIYITGETLGTVGGDAANKGGVDVFVAKIGPSGGVHSYWQRGSAGDDFPAGIAVDACGRVFVGGFTTGALVAGQPNAGGRDMFVVKADLR
jgi:streptogramin lyase